MTVRYEPPINYRRWDGGGGVIDVPPGDWHYPKWEPMPPVKDWVDMGWAPTPRTPWRGFVHHFGHGLQMGYPLLDVLVFSWRNRRSFMDGAA